MRPPTTMSTRTARELGFDEPQRPVYEINAGIQDGKGAKRVEEILSVAPHLRPLSCELKEKGYPAAAIVEELLKRR